MYIEITILTLIYRFIWLNAIGNAYDYVLISIKTNHKILNNNWENSIVIVCAFDPVFHR